MINFEEILPHGKENAIASQELCQQLGLRSVRKLQAEIAKARNDGKVILSAPNGGYFLPETDAEIRSFVKTLTARAANTFRALQSAKGRLKESAATEDGFQQLSFEDILRNI